jgi:hypothetical protein
MTLYKNRHVHMFPLQPYLLGKKLWGECYIWVSGTLKNGRISKTGLHVCEENNDA